MYVSRRAVWGREDSDHGLCLADSDEYEYLFSDAHRDLLAPAMGVRFRFRSTAPSNLLPSTPIDSIPPSPAESHIHPHRYESSHFHVVD